MEERIRDIKRELLTHGLDMTGFECWGCLTCGHQTYEHDCKDSPKIFEEQMTFKYTGPGCVSCNRSEHRAVSAPHLLPSFASNKEDH